MEARHPRFSRVVRVFREPLLQFVTIGAVLFVVAHAIAKEKAEATRKILIDTNVVRRLANLYELQTGTQPSPPKLDALVDEYVREEVLYREALRMGLDQNDEIVRRRLTQKLEFLERDLVVIPEPSDAALKAYYEDNAAEFTKPATVTFSHIYFSPDIGGDEAAKRRADAALLRIQVRHTAGAPHAGDRFPLQRDYADIDQLDLAQLFGKSPIVDALFSLPTGRWLGPVQSGYGWHLVFISGRKEAMLPPLAEIMERVKQSYIDTKRREANEKKVEEMELAYTITRAYGGGAE